MLLEARLIELNRRIAPKGPDGFFGAVYDETSASADLPVALVVGINYGQEGTSKSVCGRWKDKIRYAEHVAQMANKKKLPVRDYSVVLWNFYPFLTEKQWTKEHCNSRDEAQLIFDSGYKDPFATFETICRELSPAVLIFHGVTSAVPILARIALRRINRSGLLVPNLSYWHLQGIDHIDEIS